MPGVCRCPPQKTLWMGKCTAAPAAQHLGAGARRRRRRRRKVVVEAHVLALFTRVPGRTAALIVSAVDHPAAAAPRCCRRSHRCGRGCGCGRGVDAGDLCLRGRPSPPFATVNSEHLALALTRCCGGKNLEFCCCPLVPTVDLPVRLVRWLVRAVRWQPSQARAPAVPVQVGRCLGVNRLPLVQV